ncbi:MAG: hypothetical protein LC114_03965 [Bryobacterales bacterium]|nr:hypothetical protein [Bryobacterales bacterium]
MTNMRFAEKAQGTRRLTEMLSKTTLSAYRVLLLVLFVTLGTPMARLGDGAIWRAINPRSHERCKLRG